MNRNRWEERGGCSVMFHFGPLPVWQVVEGGGIRLSNSIRAAGELESQSRTREARRASIDTGGVALFAQKAHHLEGRSLIFPGIWGVGGGGI